MTSILNFEFDDIRQPIDGFSLFLVYNPPRNPTEKTIRHVGKLSRTLKRRLTQRTIYEARALQKQGKNIIHVLLSMTDMVFMLCSHFLRHI